MSTRINQTLDEGQDGDERALQLADIRALILNRIQDQYGLPSWSKADALGKSLVPTMAAQTIVKFATGQTKRPSTWTIKALSEVVEFRMVFVPKGTKLPQGSIEI